MEHFHRTLDDRSVVTTGLWTGLTRSLGQAAIGVGSDAAAARMFATSLRSGWNDKAADKLSHVLRRSGDAAEAARVARHVAQHDPSGQFSHLAGYLEEVAADRGLEPRSPEGRVCVFGDTDHRVNIGCRLTSKAFKRFVADCTGDAPYGVPFIDDAADLGARLFEDDVAALEHLVERHHGPNGVAAARAASMIALQPEGRLSSGSTYETILGFLSPIALGRLLGKPVVLANGTLPIYADERSDAIRAALALCDRHAMRDAISAEHYGSEFVPDAALAYRPANQLQDNSDGCLITTGARNTRAEDAVIAAAGLAVCRRHGLRPVMLTKHVHHFRAFRKEVLAMGGVFADTASLPMAAETVSGCRLHVGARYHMAILAADCRVPTALFDVDTQKNRWLAEAVDGIGLVFDENEALTFASTWLETARPPAPNFRVADGLATLFADLPLHSVLDQADGVSAAAIARFRAVA